MSPVDVEMYMISDPLCGCGSTITVQRKKMPTWGKPADSVKAWCTDHPTDGHSLPLQVRLLIAAERGQPR